MKLPRKIFPCFGALVCAASVLGGEEKNPVAVPEAEPASFRFSGELDVEQAYMGDADVERGPRHVDNLDELYSHLRFVFTPRSKIGLLRLGAEFERYSFGYSNGGQQLPNTLQTLDAIVGLDTEFSDSFLVRLEAQPGIYGDGFDHLSSDQFNVPFILGGTYIYRPELQFVLGVGVNFEQKYPVLPGGGVRWKFAPQWVLNAVLPAPRLEFSPSKAVKLFAGAEIKANAFRVDRHFGDSHGDPTLNNAWLSYEEVRTGAGIEFALGNSLTLKIEGGYLPYRDEDYHRTEVRYRSDGGGPYAAMALTGSF